MIITVAFTIRRQDLTFLLYSFTLARTTRQTHLSLLLFFISRVNPNQLINAVPFELCTS